MKNLKISYVSLTMLIMAVGIFTFLNFTDSAATSQAATSIVEAECEDGDCEGKCGYHTVEKWQTLLRRFKDDYYKAEVKKGRPSHVFVTCKKAEKCAEGCRCIFRYKKERKGDFINPAPRHSTYIKKKGRKEIEVKQTWYKIDAKTYKNALSKGCYCVK